MTHRFLIFTALMTFIAQSAAAQGGAPATSRPAAGPVYTFIGQSRATPQLKRDVMIAVAGYVQHRHGCKTITTITTIETTPLPQGYEPKTAMFRVSEPQHIYERWTADVCGTKRPFLVALWPSPKGGADYKVVEVPSGTEP